MKYQKPLIFLLCMAAAANAISCKKYAPLAIETVKVHDGYKELSRAQVTSLFDGNSETTWIQESDSQEVFMDFVFQQPKVVYGFKITNGHAKADERSKYQRIAFIQVMPNSLRDYQEHLNIGIQDVQKTQRIILEKPFEDSVFRFAIRRRHNGTLNKLAIADIELLGGGELPNNGAKSEEALKYEKFSWAVGSWSSSDGPAGETKLTLSSNGDCSGTYYNHSSGLNKPVQCSWSVDDPVVVVTAGVEIDGQSKRMNWRIYESGGDGLRRAN